jgi:uncharacterized protein
MKKALIIFIKNPEKGKVKTRLAATMGEDLALDIYRQLLAQTYSLSIQTDASVFIFYSDEIPANDEWVDKVFDKSLQQGSDLGERMHHAFTEVSKKGFHHIVIIGSDCPQLDQEILEDAFKKLQEFDVVIGPARDGGYYLLGMKNICRELFNGKSWSSNILLEETLEECHQKGLTHYLLTELSDIDHETDWEEHLQKMKE